MTKAIAILGLNFFCYNSTNGYKCFIFAETYKL